MIQNRTPKKSSPDPSLPAAPGSALRDNRERGNVASFLEEKIKPDTKLAFVSAYFTIYAYHHLKDCLDRIDTASPDLLAIIKREGAV